MGRILLTKICQGEDTTHVFPLRFRDAHFSMRKMRAPVCRTHNEFNSVARFNLMCERFTLIFKGAFAHLTGVLHFLIPRSLACVIFTRCRVRICNDSSNNVKSGLAKTIPEPRKALV